MVADALGQHVVVRRAADRFRTDRPGGCSRYSFSFGAHYDPANVFHGALIACTEELLHPGAGFPDHEHRDVEIVTWVAEGVVAHAHSGGAAVTLSAPAVQVLSAGAGLVHSEGNASATDPVRFIQMWVMPDERATDPRYQRGQLAEPLASGRLTTVASGRAGDAGTAALRLRNRGAALHAARLRPGEVVTLPEARHLHVFVVTGTAQLTGAGELSTGDEVRCTEAPALRLSTTTAAEVLIWEMHTALVE